MTTLTIRPSVGKTKSRTSAVAEHPASTAECFADIAALVKLNNSTGQVDEDTLVCDLQEFFEASNVDKARDLRLWNDTHGKLTGFGQLVIIEQDNELEGYLYFDVHPTQGSYALETEILQWSEKRLREVAKKRSLSAKLRLRSQENKILRRVLLEKQGFTAERCFLTKACSLNQSLSLPSLPSGFTLRSLSGEQELQAWVDLFNESFIDHWDHHDIRLETVRQWLKNPSYRPDLNLIAVAPGGTFAAFCVGYSNQEENTRTGRNEGWIKLLGTRRGFRKLGLGRALLLAQMNQQKAAGVDCLKLGVDAQNLTSATRLYESLGFQTVNTWLSYAKKIQPYSLNRWQTRTLTG